MFLVCAELRSRITLQGYSCRTKIMHYKSQILHKLKWLLLLPFFILGILEETQPISVELFSSYEIDPVCFYSNFYIFFNFTTIKN